MGPVFNCDQHWDASSLAKASTVPYGTPIIPEKDQMHQRNLYLRLEAYKGKYQMHGSWRTAAVSHPAVKHVSTHPHTTVP